MATITVKRTRKVQKGSHAADVQAKWRELKGNLEWLEGLANQLRQANDLDAADLNALNRADMLVMQAVCVLRDST